KLLKNLTDLHLVRTRITDEGLKKISELSDLEVLSLAASRQFTDAGLMHLKKLHKLRSLDLWVAKISDKGLVHLGGMTSLRSLKLNIGSSNPITDAGLAELAGLTDLEELDLFAQRITDASLPLLKKFTKLRSLDIAGTNISFEGATELEKALPKTKIR